jgi:hypothetical protein
MSSYRGMHTDSPWPLPVPAVSLSAAGRQGRPVSPSGSVGDTLRARRGEAVIVPAVSGGAVFSAGRQLPAASAGTGPPPVSRPAPGTAAVTGATATPPTEAPPAPDSSPPASIDSAPSAPPAVTPAAPTRGGRHHRRSRWEIH